MKTPKLPDPIRAPMQTAPQGLSAAAPPTSGIFRPALMGFNQSRPGRRSLIGG